MKFLKGKGIILGLIIGSTLTISTGVFADTSKLVSAYLADHIRFEFDGEYKSAPAEQSAIMYKDSVYVPARFVAENIGGEVKWDAQTRTVKIKSPEPEVIEKIVYVEKEDECKENEQKDEKKSSNYKTIPVTKTYTEMEVTASLIVREGNETRVYFSLENKQKTPLQLKQRETLIEVDGKPYSIEDIHTFKWDSKWYDNIKEDETLEGYIIFPGVPEESKYMDIELSIMKVDGEYGIIKVPFSIKLEDK